MKRFAQYNEESTQFFGAVDKVSKNKWYPEYGTEKTKDRFQLRVAFIPGHGLVSFNPNLLHASAIKRMYLERRFGVKPGMLIPAGYARMVIGPKKEVEYLVKLDHSYSIQEGWNNTVNVSMKSDPYFNTKDKELFKRTALALTPNVKVEVNNREVNAMTPEFLEMLAMSLENT